jgi:flavin reductase (DIM6/NTAB) family NADH-FMN oxidoreductase RutF
MLGPGEDGPRVRSGYNGAMGGERDELEAFGEIVAALDYPMVIVTAASRGERAGCLVGYATPASIEPPRYLAFLSKRNRTFRVASHAASLIVHPVPEDAHDLARLFGGETGDATDKFDLCEWREGPGGAPILERCPGWFAGSILERWDAGDHVGFLLEPTSGEGRGATHPYRTHQAEEIEPGHEA